MNETGVIVLSGVVFGLIGAGIGYLITRNDKEHLRKYVFRGFVISFILGGFIGPPMYGLIF